MCRRSSGVERVIGNDEVHSSILCGGTIKINGLEEYNLARQDYILSGGTWGAQFDSFSGANDI
jgi:hypothetical protein